jgi:hypothetical protein
MHKLIMVWLMGAAVLALSPFDAAPAQARDEDASEAQAKVAQIQAILDEENEGLLDDDDLESDQGEPDSQGEIEDDLEDQDHPSDTSDELGSSGEWETST